MKDTTIEYTQACSLHGVQYIFESGRNLKASRVIWLGLAIAAAILGIVWSVEVGYFILLANYQTSMSLLFDISQQAYVDWQENPILTSLKTTGMPISNIDFPAITICGQGSIKEVI